MNSVKNGQWIGSDKDYDALILDLDEFETHLEGSFLVFSRDSNEPSFMER